MGIIFTFTFLGLHAKSFRKWINFMQTKDTILNKMPLPSEKVRGKTLHM